MNHSELEKALLDGSTDLSEKKLHHSIELELQKDDGDIDMSLIDNYFTLLETVDRINNQNKRHINIKKTRKMAFVAAITLILVCSVSAAYYLGLSQQKADDNTKIAASSQASAASYIEEQLSAYGVSPVILPEEMINGNCTVTNIKDLTTGSTAAVTVEFKYSNFSGKMLIENDSEKLELNVEEAAANAVSEQGIKSTETDIFIFEYENYCLILYKIQSAIYHIDLECDIETATEFAKTIK